MRTRLTSAMNILQRDENASVKIQLLVSLVFPLLTYKTYYYITIFFILIYIRVMKVACVFPISYAYPMLILYYEFYTIIG